MDISTILIFGFAALFLAFAFIYFKARNKISALESELNQLRKAKSFDEMEIKKLKNEKEELQSQLDASRTRSR